jgi:catechol 2,3-dioxygenase-like lactoylglutathione lyase family enzyme
MKFDHIALVSKNIAQTVAWYQNNFSDIFVKYQDDTWALCNICGVDISFVLKSQHPAHISFCLNSTEVEKIKRNKEKIFKNHRDGTSSCYERDIDGNIIEYLIR